MFEEKKIRFLAKQPRWLADWQTGKSKRIGKQTIAERKDVKDKRPAKMNQSKYKYGYR